MAASTVTGRGNGMSNGLFKRDNNCGCGCGCANGNCSSVTSTPVKIGCYKSYKSGQTTSYKTGSISSTRVCS